jgi:hypothetical protein
MSTILADSLINANKNVNIYGATVLFNYSNFAFMGGGLG